MSGTFTELEECTFGLHKMFCVQVEPLWKLLFKLLSYCEFGKVDEITERACYELQPG